MDTHLYSIGAYFCDRHPELVEDVIAESETIESRGLVSHADAEGISLESCLPDADHRAWRSATSRR